MLNQVVLVGRLVDMPRYCADNELYQIKICTDDDVTLPVFVWGGMAQTIEEKYPMGTIMGIKGKLVCNIWIEILAERISFMTAKED